MSITITPQLLADYLSEISPTIRGFPLWPVITDDGEVQMGQPLTRSSYDKDRALFLEACKSFSTLPQPTLLGAPSLKGYWYTAFQDPFKTGTENLSFVLLSDVQERHVGQPLKEVHIKQGAYRVVQNMPDLNWTRIVNQISSDGSAEELNLESYIRVSYEDTQEYPNLPVSIDERPGVIFSALVMTTADVISRFLQSARGEQQWRIVTSYGVSKKGSSPGAERLTPTAASFINGMNNYAQVLKEVFDYGAELDKNQDRLHVHTYITSADKRTSIGFFHRGHKTVEIDQHYKIKKDFTPVSPYVGKNLQCALRLRLPTMLFK